MKKFAQKALLAGIGAFSLTREKAEQVVNEMVNRGQVKGDEANTVLDDLMKRGEEERNLIKQAIRKEFEKIREELNLVSKEELEDLYARISRLEQMISQQRENIHP